MEGAVLTRRDDLQAIMDTPGFGTGRAFRDRKARARASEMEAAHG